MCPSTLKFIDAMLKPVIHAVHLFLKRATGKERQDKQHLVDHLLTLQVAYDNLQQQIDSLQQNHERLKEQYTELEATNKKLMSDSASLQQRLRNKEKEITGLVNVADAETKSLQRELKQTQKNNQQLTEDKTILLGQVATLEADINRLSYQFLSEPYVYSGPALKATEEKDLPLDCVDLSDISLALIGGHETTYREVKKELSQYGLKRCVHIPPHSVVSSDRNQIKDKILHCDLIITITSYVDHSVAKCVKSLRDTQTLSGECIRISSHGKSSLVREVLKYFQNPLQYSQLS